MKKISCKLCFILTIVFSQYGYGNLFSCESNQLIEKTEGYDEGQTVSHTILATTEELFFGKNEILLHVDGIFFEVVSLTKEEDGWFVKYKTYAYCPKGHPLCGICKLCHDPRCFYYVRPCKGWDR